MTFDFSTFKSSQFNNYILNYIQSDLEDFFEAEKRIIENTEKYILSLKADLEKSISDDTLLNEPSNDEFDEQNKAQWYDNQYSGFETLIEEITQRHRRGAILSIYSLIEGQLNHICSHIEEESNFTIDLADLNSQDDLKKYYTYLTKVCGVSNTELEPYFTPIKQGKYFRNKIAHNNSYIDTKKITQYPSLSSRGFGKNQILIIQDPSFIYNLLASSLVFFKEVLKLIDDPTEK
jgi:hypothetical protein